MLTLVTLCQLIYLLSSLETADAYLAYFRTASKASSLVDYFILLPKIELEQAIHKLILPLKIMILISSTLILSHSP